MVCSWTVNVNRERRCCGGRPELCGCEDEVGVWNIRGSLIVRIIFHVCIRRDLSGDNIRSKQESSKSSLAQRTTCH